MSPGTNKLSIRPRHLRLSPIPRDVRERANRAPLPHTHNTFAEYDFQAWPQLQSEKPQYTVSSDSGSRAVRFVYFGREGGKCRPVVEVWGSRVEGGSSKSAGCTPPPGTTNPTRPTRPVVFHLNLFFTP
jgi:hypothetical protein